jgi:putative protein kinase ArgK-like GTPase of G3E family
MNTLQQNDLDRTNEIKTKSRSQWRPAVPSTAAAKVAGLQEVVAHAGEHVRSGVPGGGGAEAAARGEDERVVVARAVEAVWDEERVGGERIVCARLRREEEETSSHELYYIR